MKSLMDDHPHWFPQCPDHPSNRNVVVVAVVAAVDSLVCLTGLTIAESNNLKWRVVPCHHLTKD